MKLLNRIVESIHDEFSKQTDVRNLILFRALYFFTIAASTAFLDYGILISERNDVFDHYVWMSPGVYGFAGHEILKWLLVTSLLCVGAGHLYRTSLIVSLVLMVLYFHPVQVNFPSNDKNLIFVVSLIFLLVPQAAGKTARLFRENTQKETAAIWPLKMVQFSMGLVYLSSGFSKLLIGGAAWMDGQTLKTLLMESWIYSYSPLTEYVAANDMLCRALSVMTILFEVFFITTVFFRVLIRPFLASAVFFHAGTYVLMGPGLSFMKFFLPAAFAFWQPFGVVKKTEKDA